jgi:hypothetical protein
LYHTKTFRIADDNIRHEQEFGFSKTSSSFRNRYPRITHLSENNVGQLNYVPQKRSVKIYPADFSDNTQLYGLLDSEDPALSRMERRTFRDDEMSDDECVPMRPWQIAYYPVCNSIHEVNLNSIISGEPRLLLFGTKGFWRNVWRLDLLGTKMKNETVVMKTLK